MADAGKSDQGGEETESLKSVVDSAKSMFRSRDRSDVLSTSEVERPAERSTVAWETSQNASTDAGIPLKIGKYFVLAKVGKGSFGTV